MARTLSDQDAAFVMQVRPMEIAEIKMSEVAADFASDSALRELAQWILRGHARASEALIRMARDVGLDPPETPDAAHERVIDKLWSLDGPEFDRTYVQAQVRDHEQAVALFEREARRGRDPAVRRYAQTYLPTLQAHLDRVRAVARSLPG